MLLPVTAADWPAVSALLDELLALPPAERDSFVQALDGESARYRDTLRHLLAQSAGKETADLLATLPRVALPGLGDEPGAGQQVGPYRLLRELGAGGMGAVWLAERADGTLKRQVALKLPRLAWGAGLAERMARERDILAALEHPHIARLYDAGADDHGRPYLALEYVEGQPIDAYASAHGLNVRQRLELLLQVAAAVAFAHSRLVVHRDLKPSNILVTADGQARLLDFGIAKLMEGGTANETQLTRQAGRALTLAYASPEQIKGEAIGTASDVYSLGVVAYELLAGVRPYKLKRGSAAELEEAIAAVDPPRASDAAVDAQARKALRGDLDAILNKALKKDPAQRYATVEAFIDDVQAALASRPVKARPDGWAYRARKFVARNRAAVASAALLLAVAAVGAGSSIHQYRQTVAERDRTLSALEREQAVSAFMQSLITSIDIGRSVTAPELLERSEALLANERLSPPQEATVLYTIAQLHSSHGAFARAQPLIDRAVERAEQGGDREQLGLVRCLQASIAGRRGADPDAADRLERLAAEHADSDTVFVDCLTARAYLAQLANDATTAVRSAGLALERARRQANLKPAHHAMPVAALAYGHSLAGQPDSALPLYAEAIDLFRSVGQEDSVRAMTVWNNWALALLAAGDPSQALAVLDRALALHARRAAGAAPPLFVVANRARMLLNLHRLDEAVAEARRAAPLAQAAGNPTALIVAGVTEADALRLQGRSGEARARLQALRAAAQGKVPAGGPADIGLLRLQALLDAQGGHVAQARATLDQVVGMLDDRGLKTAVLASALNERAQLALRADRLPEAERDIERALAIARAAQGRQPHSGVTGLVLLERARLKALRGDAAGARADAAEAQRQLQAALGAAHPETLAAARAVSS
ncbi:protein kinase domain-containing protein [Piscinibacter sp.]|uniref:serine/threonine-protein kinase n=1 Tax=Piscinibacter sp. TaxID=1903157 RepID=UPI0039E382B1